jgi:peptide-methionine (S)-S-oxide reductase
MLTLALVALAVVTPKTVEETAVFAGGCFWGVESVFEHVRGVTSVVSGYAAGHVESVQVRFDPAVISYRQLLEVFFLVAHDPTTRDRQGPDVGPEYRAIVFYRNAAQRQAASGYLQELAAARVFPGRIVTEIQAFQTFELGEAFHQDYAARHPDQPYIVFNDAPKLEHLRSRFPALFRPLPTG